MLQPEAWISVQLFTFEILNPFIKYSEVGINVLMKVT